MKTTRCLAALILTCLSLLIAACSTPPDILLDSDVIPTGSRIVFWVNHDEDGWIESNLHIAYLPRPMTGAEARRWAVGVGARDAACFTKRPNVGWMACAAEH